MRVSVLMLYISSTATMANKSTRIVEYATRDQAQQAVAQLSNQTLMGRLVYVREVSKFCAGTFLTDDLTCHG